MRDSLAGGVAVLASSIAIPPNSTPSPSTPHHSSSIPSLSTKLSSPPSKSSSSSTSRPPLLSTVRLVPPYRARLRYQADLASKLALDGKLQDFLLIAETTVGSGVKPMQFVNLLNLEIVSAGIARMLKEEKVWCVVEVLSGFDKLGIGVGELFDGSLKEELKGECIRIVKCGQVEEVVRLMELLAGFQFSVKELVNPAEVIKLCVSRQNPGAAIRYARIFSHSHILFCNAILEFGKKGYLASALTVFEASKQNLRRANMYAYRTIIDVCGLCGDYLKSRSIYEDLLAQKITPNIYVFNSLMNVNSHDLDYTWGVYQNMQNLGVIADIASYNILLKSCCLAKRVDLAQDIYREVQRLEMTGVLKLDVLTYSTIIKVLADAKLWQMALKVKEDMLSAGVNPNVVTWSSLISACANAGVAEQAIQLFKKMLRADCKPNAQCCNVLLHACVEACQYDRAFRLFQSWKESGFQNYMHKNFTTSILDRTSSAQASTAMRIPFAPTTSTYNILLKACGTNYHRAKALTDEMKTVGLTPNRISWSILIDICGGSGNMEGAMKILKSMRDAGLQPDVVAYTTAIKICMGDKNLKLALSLFSEMKKHQIQPNLVTYNTLLRARSRYGSLEEVQQCLAIYQEMRKAGYKSNDYYLKQLIEEWCEGVMQDKIQNQSQLNYPKRTDPGGPQNVLLERVAIHLQKDNAENLEINLQGLTKVEARIVVLAVLRMIKERYTHAVSVKDDMQIILGVQEMGNGSAEHESGVKETIIKLLHNDLGLEVLLGGPRKTIDENINMEDQSGPYSKLEEMGRSRSTMQLETPVRRPAVLQRLKVTRKSLHDWLQRRALAS